MKKKMTPRGIYFNDEDYDILKSIAKKERTYVSSIIRNLIVQFIKKYKKDN